MTTQLTIIGDKAFYNCSSISGKTTFPASLTSIGTSGFYGCSSVTAFRFPDAKPIKYNSNMLPYQTIVEVPKSIVEKYKNTTGWNSNHTIEGS